VNVQPKVDPRLHRTALRLTALAFAGLALIAVPRPARSQSPSAATPATLDSTVAAGGADVEKPRRRLVKWNEYDGPISTIRLGYGFLYDFATYAQSEESKQQVAMKPDIGLRDFRLILSGRFKTKRSITWILGYMYDGAEEVWLFRKTGVQIDVPELSGRIFIGRDKEGYSMVKVMNGYHPWGMERTMMTDFIPILADGVKWMGYFPKRRLHMSLGWFGDALSEDEKFATYDHQFAARVAWTPVISEEQGRVLHVGVSGRTGNADNDVVRLRSKPEANLSPFFIDTGSIPASGARAAGFEAYYRTGSWLYGSEYHWQVVDALNGGDPTFHGGNVVAAWLITGETRGYNPAGGYFNAVSPAKTVFEGGPGAWEAVLNLSYADFNSGSIRGGTLWRLTPTVNWHLSDNLRLEAAYGYSILDRFGLEGATQFFQFRIQTLL
jgi:phosphate-selective porin OprO/OprP